MTVSPERIEEALITDLLIAVAAPDRHEDSQERKAAWDEIKRRDAALREARERAEDLAEFTMRTLETERQQTGVDEWDESDERALLYNSAWEVFGEERYGEICAEVNAALAVSPPAGEAKRFDPNEPCPYCGHAKGLHSFASRSSCVVGSPPADEAKR